MQLVLSEARKQRSFREVWVGYLLAILLLSVFIYSDSEGLEYGGWYFIQQDIHRYVGVLTAFLLVIGLSRLMCYETEQRTAGLIGTAAYGILYRSIWVPAAGGAVFYRLYSDCCNTHKTHFIYSFPLWRHIFGLPLLSICHWVSVERTGRPNLQSYFSTQLLRLYAVGELSLV